MEQLTEIRSDAARTIDYIEALRKQVLNEPDGRKKINYINERQRALEGQRNTLEETFDAIGIREHQVKQFLAPEIQKDRRNLRTSIRKEIMEDVAVADRFTYLEEIESNYRVEEATKLELCNIVATRRRVQVALERTETLILSATERNALSDDVLSWESSTNKRIWQHTSAERKTLALEVESSFRCSTAQSYAQKLRINQADKCSRCGFINLPHELWCSTCSNALRSSLELNDAAQPRRLDKIHLTFTAQYKMSFTIISMRGCGTHRGADSQLRQKAIAYLKKSTLWQTAYIDDPNHHRYANGERWTQQEAMDAYANGDYSRWEMDSNGDYVPKCPGGPYRSIHDRACRDALYRHHLQAQGYETENDWQYLG